MSNRWTAVALFATACSVTPVTGKIKIGEEAFVIAVGEGSDGATDLFAAPATAGKFYRLTFSRVVEDRPRLAPNGTLVGFFRRFPDATDLVILDLLSMGERRARLGSEASRIGWSAGADTVFVAMGRDTVMAPLAIEPFAMVPVPEAAGHGAVRALGEWLGPAGFAMVGRCRRADGVCAVVSDSVETPLGGPELEPVRWGPTAVGYLVNGEIEVRPLGGGRATRPTLADAPRGLRQLTHHPGGTATDPTPPTDAHPPR